MLCFAKNKPFLEPLKEKRYNLSSDGYNRPKKPTVRLKIKKGLAIKVSPLIFIYYYFMRLEQSTL